MRHAALITFLMRTIEIDIDAAGVGIEPTCQASKACVLPLDDPASDEYSSYSYGRPYGRGNRKECQLYPQVTPYGDAGAQNAQHDCTSKLPANDLPQMRADVADEVKIIPLKKDIYLGSDDV